MVLEKSKIYFVSNLDDELVERIGYMPFKNKQFAII